MKYLIKTYHTHTAEVHWYVYIVRKAIKLNEQSMDKNK